MDITGITIEDLERELQRRRTAQVREYREEILKHLASIRVLEQQAEAILSRTPGSRPIAAAPQEAHVSNHLRAIGNRLHQAMKELGENSRPESLREATGLNQGEYLSAVRFLVASGRAQRLGHGRGMSYLAI